MFPLAHSQRPLAPDTGDFIRLKAAVEHSTLELTSTSFFIVSVSSPMYTCKRVPRQQSTALPFSGSMSPMWGKVESTATSPIDQNNRGISFGCRSTSAVAVISRALAAGRLKDVTTHGQSTKAQAFGMSTLHTGRKESDVSSISPKSGPRMFVEAIDKDPFMEVDLVQMFRV